MSYPLLDVRRFCFVLLSFVPSLVISALAAQTVMAQAQHPLDHLTAEEIKTAARVLNASAQFPQGALFSTIVLKEPLKDEVLSYSQERIGHCSRTQDSDFYQIRL